VLPLHQPGMEPKSGIEPLTSSVRKKRSATELFRHIQLGVPSDQNPAGHIATRKAIGRKARSRTSHCICRDLAALLYIQIGSLDLAVNLLPLEGLPTLVRVAGIEPTFPPWQGGVKPLNYTRMVPGEGFEPPTICV
jgi:hypothetical protein